MSDVQSVCLVSYLIVLLLCAYNAFKFWYQQRLPDSLKAGKCECGHSRCAHTKGRYDCHVSTGIGASCACQMFIDRAPDPAVEELERMHKL